MNTLAVGTKIKMVNGTHAPLKGEVVGYNGDPSSDTQTQWWYDVRLTDSIGRIISHYARPWDVTTLDEQSRDILQARLDNVIAARRATGKACREAQRFGLPHQHLIEEMMAFDKEQNSIEDTLELL